MKFTFPFCYTPRPEIVAAARRLTARIDASPELRSLFAEGKMLGVLMVEDASGETGYLYGFSGLAGGRNQVEGFVPPIFDLLDPNGHFKREEAALVDLTRQIRALSSSPAPTGDLSDHEMADPVDRDAQGQVGHDVQARIAALKFERRERSVALQEWIFEQFEVLNARGERLTIAEVFARRGLVPPSGTGECAAPKLLQYAYLRGMKPLAMGEFWYGASPAGELRRAGSFYPSCTGKCGPLLDFMLEGLDVDPDPLLSGFPSQVQNSLICTPGPSKSAAQVQNSLIRTADPSKSASQVQKSPICTAAIPVIYEDEAILVVDKPSGILAVPGRTNPVSVPALLEREHGVLYPCHRLDMDTSGLMVYAKSVADQAALQRQFAGRFVRKSYRATLIPEMTGNLPTKRDLTPGAKGWIDLPIAPDWYDRPRQRVDKKDGKSAVTEYEVLAVRPDGAVEVRLTPHTGRTHQLRVHAAHPEGLGRPILGDRLYGGHTPDLSPTQTTAPGIALQLRADRLSFRHPRTGVQMEFNAESESK